MKFSIRDLLLVTVIVALAVGWWVDRQSLADKLNSNERKILGLEQELKSRNDEILAIKSSNPSYPPAP